ncbi:hypothetical protein, partial [Vannielia sp.]|uniref:hypothetical protein n=1 Tax=Vannielia sp. TaxID=2813045 RepID=UPI002628645D
FLPSNQRQPKTVARRPVGWCYDGHSEALYGCKVIFRSFDALMVRKRQPAGRAGARPAPSA